MAGGLLVTELAHVGWGGYTAMILCLELHISFSVFNVSSKSFDLLWLKWFIDVNK